MAKIGGPTSLVNFTDWLGPDYGQVRFSSPLFSFSFCTWSWCIFPQYFEPFLGIFLIC